jgi:hypothetical protein
MNDIEPIRRGRHPDGVCPHAHRAENLPALQVDDRHRIIAEVYHVGFAVDGSSAPRQAADAENRKLLAGRRVMDRDGATIAIAGDYVIHPGSNAIGPACARADLPARCAGVGINAHQPARIEETDMEACRARRNALRMHAHLHVIFRQRHTN